jgi:hypothetical protein
LIKIKAIVRSNLPVDKALAKWQTRSLFGLVEVAHWTGRRRENQQADQATLRFEILLQE